MKSGKPFLGNKGQTPLRRLHICRRYHTKYTHESRTKSIEGELDNKIYILQDMFTSKQYKCFPAFNSVI